ncbi:MAG: methyltransferase domain-containing protein [Deltaproteobacteria bacterium]
MTPGFATLATRNRQPELMDQPGLDEGLHGQALRGLAWINWISNTSLMIWRQIHKLAREPDSPRPLRILDVACGGGDVAQRLARRAQRAGIAAHVDGCDINPVAIAHARAAAPRWRTANVSFFQHDALRDPLPEGYDVVTSSLFLHHLDDADAERMLRAMASGASRLVVNSDLRRSRLGYALACVAGRILTRSPIVHVDGPLSVAAAFTVDEARDLAARAGMTGVSFIRYFPERYLLVWRKPL